MASRQRNERTFGHWDELPDGGRRCWLDVEGRHGWRARYMKQVDRHESTVRFHQEIRDETGRVVEVHKKLPVDHGHKKA